MSLIAHHPVPPHELGAWPTDPRHIRMVISQERIINREITPLGLKGTGAVGSEGPTGIAIAVLDKGFEAGLDEQRATIGLALDSPPDRCEPYIENNSLIGCQWTAASESAPVLRCAVAALPGQGRLKGRQS